MPRPSFQMSADTKVIRSVLEECDIGQTVTYDTLSKAIGRDVRQFASGSIASARRSLLHEKQLVFECVHGVGYVRLDNSGIVSSMERDRKHISRASTKSLTKLKCVEYEKLTNEEKKAHTVAAAQFGALSMMARASSARRIESNVRDRKVLAIGETLKLFTSGANNT